MNAICYTVGVTLPDEPTVERWLAWMRGGHIADVMAGGAVAAEIVQMDGAGHSFEVRYRFESRESFDRYIRDHATRLRTEGLKLFPATDGVEYRRTVGVVVDSIPS